MKKILKVYKEGDIIYENVSVPKGMKVITAFCSDNGKLLVIPFFKGKRLVPYVIDGQRDFIGCSEDDLRRIVVSGFIDIFRDNDFVF